MSRPSVGPNIARPSVVDHGYRPTQSAGTIRPNNQSKGETESQRKDRIFEAFFSISVDDRHPSDVYGPSANNRPIGSPDNISAGGRGQPGTYDTTSGDNNGSQQKQPNIQSRPTDGGSSPTYPYTGTSHDSRPTTAVSDERQPGRYPDGTGSGNSVSTYPRAPDSTTSDVYNAVRNAFKLPPGLCLVRCDTLRSNQQILTPQQAHDAFISAGIISPSYPSSGAGSQDTSQPGTSRLPQNQLSQYPIGSQAHEIPSGSQLSGLHPGGNGQISYVGDPNLISNRPAGGIPSQQGGDVGGYQYQTPKDRLPSNIGGHPIGKIAATHI